MGLTLASSYWPFVCRSVPRISVVNNGSGRRSKTALDALEEDLYVRWVMILLHPSSEGFIF